MTGAEVRRRRDYGRLALAVGRWAVAAGVTAAVALLLIVVRDQDGTIGDLRAQQAVDRAQQEQINKAVAALGQAGDTAAEQAGCPSPSPNGG